MESLPEVSRSMTDAGIKFESTVYENARHAFFNDTNETTYDAEAAADSWSRVLEFFRNTVSTVRG